MKIGTTVDEGRWEVWERHFCFCTFSYSRLLPEAWGTHICTSSQGAIMIVNHLIRLQRHQHSDKEVKKMVDDRHQEVQERHLYFCTNPTIGFYVNVGGLTSEPLPMAWQ
jgi:hypothetical protein